jgi:hypothetical protein
MINNNSNNLNNKNQNNISFDIEELISNIKQFQLPTEVEIIEICSKVRYIYNYILTYIISYIQYI